MKQGAKKQQWKIYPKSGSSLSQRFEGNGALMNPCAAQGGTKLKESASSFKDDCVTLRRIIGLIIGIN